MAANDKKLIQAPISLWGVQRREKKWPKNPRPKCPICKSTCYACRIDKGRVKNPEKKKVGRPKKGKSTTRYTKIGYWCDECEIFYYMDGTPNYKLRLKSK